MPKTHPILSYIFVSLLTLILCFAITVGAFLLIQDAVRNPTQYGLGFVDPAQFHFYILAAAGIILSLALSLVTYVVLLTRARVNLAVWNATRWLAVSREQFRRMYDDAPIPYLTLSAEGKMYEPNKAALRFYGVQPEEIAEQNFFSFYSAENPERIAELEEFYTRGVPINNEEVEITTKAGAKKWVQLSVFTMQDAGSTSMRGLATLLDITEAKRLDRTKTEFLSLASHQLRTPLATIKWYMDMLLSSTLGTLTEKQRDYVSRVYDADQGMIDLVDTLLNVSRSEMGKLPVENEHTNVGEVVDSILSEMTPQISKRELQVQKQYGGMLTDVVTDPNLLRIVLHNLMSNAVKYTPSQGTLTITFGEERGVRLIQVADTGVGIPKEQQDQIFGKMFRADNVKKLAEAPGTGLGLYLVKSIVETLHGNISFVSEENKGTKFTITL